MVYWIFYLLFSPDTWRVLMGAVLAVLLAPRIAGSEVGVAGRAMLCVMITAIGWAVTAAPARWITGMLKRGILPRDPRS